MSVPPPPGFRPASWAARIDLSASTKTPNAPTPSSARAALVAPLPDTSLGAEVDALFDGATVTSAAEAGPGRVEANADTEQEIRRLFSQIAAHHCAQLRDFLVELSLSPTSKRWIEICAPALGSIQRAAAGIEHEALSQAIEDLQRALDNARRGPAPLIVDTPRTTLLEAFGRLARLLPEAFDVDQHRSRRDPIIVHTLLEQVPGISVLSIERIYAAGLSTLGALYAARSDEISVATGVSAEVSDAVTSRFGQYRRARAERAENAGHDDERAKVRQLLDQLRQRHAAFRDAELQENAREKRKMRTARTDLLRQIYLALAHLGQADLVTAIATIPVDAKIERIGGYLQRPAAGA